MYKKGNRSRDFRVIWVKIDPKTISWKTSEEIDVITDISLMLCGYLHHCGCYAKYTLRYGTLSRIEIGFPSWMMGGEQELLLQTLSEYASEHHAIVKKTMDELSDKKLEIIAEGEEDDEEKESV